MMKRKRARRLFLWVYVSLLNGALDVADDEVADSVGGEQDDEANDGAHENALGLFDFVFVTSGGHPEKTSVDDEDEEDDTEETEKSLDEGTDGVGEGVGRLL